jgi:hypothetical protein
MRRNIRRHPAGFQGKYHDRPSRTLQDTEGLIIALNITSYLSYIFHHHGQRFSWASFQRSDTGDTGRRVDTRHQMKSGHTFHGDDTPLPETLDGPITRSLAEPHSIRRRKPGQWPTPSATDQFSTEAAIVRILIVLPTVSTRWLGRQAGV